MTLKKQVGYDFGFEKMEECKTSGVQLILFAQYVLQCRIGAIKVN